MISIAFVIINFEFKFYGPLDFVILSVPRGEMMLVLAVWKHNEVLLDFLLYRAFVSQILVIGIGIMKTLVLISNLEKKA